MASKQVQAAWADLLDAAKKNLIIEHDADDALLTGMLHDAADYAEQFQHKPAGTYSDPSGMLGATRRAVIMLASHFYESRDGGQGGFFGGTAEGTKNLRATIDDLLRLDREWKV